jgi:hypothetical protein
MEYGLRLLGVGIVSALVAAASNIFNWGLAWWASILIGFFIVFGASVLMEMDL